MLTEPTTGTLIGNNRILSFFQSHGSPLNRTPLITASTNEKFRPGVTFLPVEFGKPHFHLFYGNIMKGIGGTDSGTAHAEMTGGLLRINLRSTGFEKIKPPPHFNAVKNTYLGTLTALQTTGQKLFFSSGARRA